MKIKFNKSAFIIPAILIFFTACDLDVPVKEMVDAKQGIEEAYKYKANLYSPDELKEAENELLRSNEFLKNEKTDDAKKSAIESKALSDKALEKSLPLYSADMLQKAEESWLKADKLFASRFSPKKFQEAESKLSMSKEANSKAEYRESLELSAEVISLSNQASDDSSKIKSREILLLTRIEKARKELAEAENMDTTLTHEKNLIIAKSLINKSEAELKSGKYNNSEDAIDEAETMIASIRNSIEKSAKVIVTIKAAETDSKTKEKQPVLEEKTYTVQWHKKNTDCLWRIALKVYNDASFWPVIYIANKEQIKDPDLIFPGQKFKIPAKPEKRPEYKPESSKGANKKAN